MEYLSADYVGKSETLESSHFRSLTTEFLNSLTTSGLPNHSIKIKKSPIMLLRNLDQTQGLCNDTRLIVTNSSYKIVMKFFIFISLFLLYMNKLIKNYEINKNIINKIIINVILNFTNNKNKNSPKIPQLKMNHRIKKLFRA